MVPSELKEISSKSSFKKEINEWYSKNFPFRLCKEVFHLDYVKRYLQPFEKHFRQTLISM